MQVSGQLHAQARRFTPRERAPGTHWIGGWVGPRAVLDAVVKRKILIPHRESNPRTLIVQPVAYRLSCNSSSDLCCALYEYHHHHHHVIHVLYSSFEMVSVHRYSEFLCLELSLRERDLLHVDSLDHQELLLYIICIYLYIYIICYPQTYRVRKLYVFQDGSRL
jgi:hypothetical protein